MSTPLYWVRVTESSLPWAFPVLLIWLVVALTLARPLGRRLGMSRWLVLGALLSVGLVVAITLTPLDAAASTAQGIGQGSFVLEAPPTKIFRSPSEWWPIDDRSLNILLFVPLGFVVALMPRRWFLPAVVVALLAPVVVEGLQWLLPVLRRDPQWQDVADNMVGVVVGVLIAVAARWGAARYRARDGARAGARASRRP